MTRAKRVLGLGLSLVLLGSLAGCCKLFSRKDDEDKGAKSEAAKEDFVAAIAGTAPPELDAFALEAGGRVSVVALGDEDGFVAAFALGDELRAGAQQAVARLAALGISTSCSPATARRPRPCSPRPPAFQWRTATSVRTRSATASRRCSAPARWSRWWATASTTPPAGWPSSPPGGRQVHLRP